jgi:lactate dehydrogenase-like 2-hydroxyacid dehydrogenase
MKESTIFISIVHGLFDEQTIIDMVQENKLFGFGFEADPASFSNYDGNIFAAPAYAWATNGSMNNSMTKWIENMVNAGESKFPTKVN